MPVMSKTQFISTALVRFNFLSTCRAALILAASFLIVACSKQSPSPAASTDWAGIDQLMIYNSLADWGVSWAMDDFTVDIHPAASVPEASGLVLMLMGLLGVGVLRRRA